VSKQVVRYDRCKRGWRGHGEWNFVTRHGAGGRLPVSRLPNT
jgi:hypothetical protein